MCEEKRQVNDVTSGYTSCCGPAMEKKIRIFFASARSEGEDETGSCADRMAEMMEVCCGPFTSKVKPSREDDSAID